MTRTLLPDLEAVHRCRVAALARSAIAGGLLSPLNDALDVLLTLTMVRLLGWHFAFLPTFVAELVPGVDLVPTWTAAVWLSTRQGAERLR